MLKTAFALLFVSLKSIGSRLAPSLIILFGIGGVVAVLVALFAIAQGFERTLKNTGQPDRVLVLRAGSTSEINGNMSTEQFEILRELPQIKRHDNNPLAARETFVTVNLPQLGSEVDGSVPMRGVSTESFAVRSEVTIVAGRRFEPGKFELVAGVKAAAGFQNLQLNQTIRIRGVTWQVVGLFSADGNAYESEIWTDEPLLAQTWQRTGSFSTMLARLDSPADFAEFKAALAADPRLTAHAIAETEHYASQAQNTAGLIRGVGLLVGSIMTIGALFAALNTMYSALATRVGEISTLRALGFGRGAILMSILFESALLGFIGAVLGAGTLYLFLNNLELSTVAATSATYTQIAFKFAISPALVGNAILLAVALGALGGLFPALRALRMPIPIGLRNG